MFRCYYSSLGEFTETMISKEHLGVDKSLSNIHVLNQSTKMLNRGKVPVTFYEL